MRPPRSLLVVPLLCGVLRVFAETPPPPHPTALFATYKGERQAVVAVEKEDPVILVDGQRKRLRGNIPLSTERQPRYAGLHAEVAGQKAAIVQVLQGTNDTTVEQIKDAKGATVGGYVEYSATITAREDLKDCFVALIAVDDDFVTGRTDQPNSQIRVRELPALRAGAATPIKFSTSPFLSRKKMTLFVLVFSEGREVVIGQQPGIDRYFHRRERVVHAATVRKWLADNPGASRPVQPVQQIPPLLGRLEGLPENATATLSIAPDGTVANVALDREFTPAAEAVLTNTLHAWLFLPKLQNGVAVPAQVRLPLRF